MSLHAAFRRPADGSAGSVGNLEQCPGRSRPARSAWGRRVLLATVVGAGAVGSLGLVAGTASAATTSDWERLASCESGGNWSIDTGNGYYGGVQFSSSTWLGYGGGTYASTANRASETEQIAIANRVLAAQGWHAWPVCSVKEGLAGLPTTGGPTSAPGRGSAPAPHPHRTVAKHRAAAGHMTVSQHTYTVRIGDSLSTIAVAEAVPGGWHSLWALNKKVVRNPNVVKVGQRLRLPGTHA